MAGQAKLAYFKAITRAKATYWADFLAKTTPSNIWTAKQLVAPRTTPRFLSLPGASDLGKINQALLDHFFPLKGILPSRGSIRIKGNGINPSIILDLLSPLVALGYHPPTLKTANGVVLVKPGKASYTSPSSFRIMGLLKTI